MQTQIAELVEQFETGRITRRELVARLTAFAAAMSTAAQAARAQEEKSTFQAVSLNHIALRVPDVARSRDFYQKHLGLEVRRETPGRSCFLTFGNNFLALFRADSPRMDHYCFSIKDYDQKAAAEKLRAHGIQPEVPPGTNRIYFPDPDGLKVQLAATEHRP